MKIYAQNHTQSYYITQRYKDAMYDSLFLTQDALRYSGEHKDAYELLHRSLPIHNDKSREILRHILRTIIVSEEETIHQEEGMPHVQSKKEILKGRFTASYNHIKIELF